MSAKTSPHSTRARAAPRGGGFGGEPNPLLMRELLQSLRVPRLPWTIAAAVALIGLGMISFGSLGGTFGSSAQQGAAIFQFFLVVLMLYVGLVGPATAAATIATEREGRTLEPLLLTSLSTSDIARGKFLAAYATLMLQVVALLPLAAIPLLFGGVGTSELIVATVWIMALGAVSVGFGLVVASRAQTMRGALAVSILLPTAVAPSGFGVLFGLGELARHRWPFIGVGPTWWTGAYGSVPFGVDYVLFLLVWPIVLIGLPLWLFLTLTAANLAAQSEDRSSGWKRWLVATCALVGLLIIVTALRFDAVGAASVSLTGQVLTTFIASLGVLLVAGEPLAPTRLVQARWLRLASGPFARMTGPGVIRGALLQIACVGLLLGACFLAAILSAKSGGLRAWIGVPMTQAPRTNELSGLAILLTYTLLFDVFLVGLASLLRARRNGTTNAARAWTVATATLAVLLPLVVWLLGRGPERSGRFDLVAAPSPAFAYFVTRRDSLGDADAMMPAAFIAALIWGAIGVLLLGLGWERARRSTDEEAKTARATEAKLTREDDEGLAPEDDDDEDEEEQKLLAPPPAPPPRSNEPES